MWCPQCRTTELSETLTKNGVVVDSCSQCGGTWLDRGELFHFSRQPRRLEAALAETSGAWRPGERICPRCSARLEVGPFLRSKIDVDRCPECEGYWFDADELKAALDLDRRAFQLETEPAAATEPVATAAGAPDEQAHARLRDLASGLLPLPNLLVRSVGVLVLLYALLGLVLISIVEFGLMPPWVAVVVGAVIVILQFGFGPWLMDLSLRWLYKFSWLKPEELPEHLRAFVTRVAAEQGMKVPSFGLIHDGAPNAFTYGHTPNNMRIVITQGILDLLEPEEVEAVVAHEIGHGKHWDMLMMTVVQLVPLLLYYVYRTMLGSRGEKKAPQIAIGIGAYVLYIASEYIVLWFSRCREYYADRFAGQVTGNPNALAAALVKIGYGLAARGPQEPQEEKAAADPKTKKKHKRAEKATAPMLDGLGALGIFDRKAAVAMVATSARRTREGSVGVGIENLKSAMQWDLWNPWATFYELNSTHPLVAHRLEYLADQAAAMGREPYIVFDRRKPESYWDEFALDLAVLLLPAVLFVLGLGVGAVLLWQGGGLAGPGRSWLVLVGLPLLGGGVGSLLKTLWSYRGDYFAPLSVSGLLHKVKVSGVRPVPARVRGTLIGRGVPGLIWSEDFVLQDPTGILFLDYRQPLGIWNWLFGLLRAGELVGANVEATGWFRRSPVPYLELRTLTANGVTRRCYTYHFKLGFAAFLVAAGIVLNLLALL